MQHPTSSASPVPSQDSYQPASKLGLLLDRWFSLSKNGTSPSTEVIAGFTTFMTMVYIVFVNPQILGAAGMNTQAVFVVTCLAAALGSIAMGLFANLPIALAPAMGLNAFFAFSVTLGMGVSWQVAMGTVFWGAVVFALVSIVGLRQWLLENIPASLRIGIPAGIGLLIALLGFKNTGLVVAAPNTLVKVGDLTSLPAVLGSLGFFIIIILAYRGVNSAVLIATLAVTVLAALCGDVEYYGIASMPPAIDGVFAQLDLSAILDVGLAGVIFSFALVSMFDSSGTMIAVTERCGLADNKGRFPNMRKALQVDSLSSVAGAYMGTSSVTAYIESSSGASVGGRTGLTSVVVGLLFLGVIFLSPLAAMVPGYAVAGALIYVGVMMTAGLTKVDWSDLTEAAPAFITAVMMPFTFSITEGIAAGFISYCVIKLGCGKWRQIHPCVIVVAALFLVKFIFIDGH
ncbi:NCS2 family permease [Ferrimonas aestuarii]|uniref:NCS2 family permease n=1 Tax=Ferrimonas aestuarii TaxID=2569539 RepID=A0A4U1BLZ3_9GAMM|nr:NCS2 family permease [Ferrimonas aestuarii]